MEDFVVLSLHNNYLKMEACERTQPLTTTFGPRAYVHTMVEGV
jgi:hypothetical protein